MSLFSTPTKQPLYFDRIGYQAALLSGVCSLVAVLILGGNKATEEKIAIALQQDQLNMLEQVLPSTLYNNNLLEDTFRIPELLSKFGSETLYVAKRDKRVVGYAFIVTQDGYSGEIKLILGLDQSGNILGVRVISHSETPGLGDKIEISKDDWITDFDKLSLANTQRDNWAVKKDGGQFDQFTGATITPRAVVSAVLSGLDFFSNYSAGLSMLPSKESDSQEDSK
jgi:electron transport complex protein RnfG